jgi:beta-lactamase class A
MKLGSLKMKNNLLFLFCLFIPVSFSFAQIDSLQRRIERLCASENATVGVAVAALEGGEAFSVNAEKHFPMQSVYKFHLALAVLHRVDRAELSLQQKVFVFKADLLPKTWSLLREKYPEGNIALSLDELLRYTVSQSDNNGCDILFKLLGGTDTVNAYIHSLGINDVAIAATEQEMHRAWNVQYTNWSTPVAAMNLLKQFYQGNILSQSSREYLLQLMTETSTGPSRVKGLLPTETIVAHKTGSSGTNEKGISAAVNDIGIITLPDGDHIALAVFVSNSSEDEKRNDQTIAIIAKAVWDYFTVHHVVK